MRKVLRWLREFYSLNFDPHGTRLNPFGRWNLPGDEPDC